LTRTERNPVSDSDSNTDKKKAGGFFRWFFLFVLTLPFVSFYIGGYMRCLHEQVESDVHRCVQTCKPDSIKLYDAKQKICECS
jgi:hypothetical protein